MTDENDFLEKLRNILERLLKSCPEINLAIITSLEGLPILSMLPNGFNELIISATVATVLSLSERAVIEMKIDEFKQLFIKGKEGYIFVFEAELAVLSVSTTIYARIGYIIYQCKRAAEEIADVFKNMN
ncbi:MAG: roadblock/LC7 domain-containing protein [Promethearchaeota archaeon]|jgi:predicted regulator of Ras-like GTPase activity (Roadblock/LC7/MglB family)